MKPNSPSDKLGLFLFCAAGNNGITIMGNGRGKLECCYCEFYRCHNPLWRGPDAFYEAGECSYHHAALPTTLPSWEHRICRNFQPNEFFNRNAEEQFSWFPFPLKERVLYGFCYNTPENVREIASFGAHDGDSAPGMTST